MMCLHIMNRKAHAACNFNPLFENEKLINVRCNFAIPYTRPDYDTFLPIRCILKNSRFLITADIGLYLEPRCYFWSV